MAERDADVEAALLAAVRAAPADDGPRAIYSDWLQERGDPRGELIALQLATATAPRGDRTPERERADALLAQHREHWIGPIAGCLARGDFERGFLASCEVAWSPDRTARVATPADPAWATVRAIHGGLPATDAHPMPILASARDLDAAAVVHLASLASPPPLVMLGWRSAGNDWSAASGYDDVTSAAIAAFARVLPRIPTLRRLHVDGARSWIDDRMRPDQLEWPWRETTIRELRVTANVDQLAAWFGEVVGSELDKFELAAGSSWRVTLARDELVIDAGYNRFAFRDGLAALAAAIECLPSGHLRSLKMQVCAKDLWTLDNRRRMARALDHQPRLATIDIHGFYRPR